MNEQYLQQVSDNPKNHYPQCLEFAQSWIKSAVRTFTSEDIIAAYKKANEAQPAEPRVWGAVIRHMSDKGLIKGMGWSEYRNPKGHCKPSRIWKTVNPIIEIKMIPIQKQLFA